MLTKFHGRRERGSLVDGLPVPHQGLVGLSMKNRLMSEQEKSRHQTLVLVVRICLGTRRWKFCLPI